MRGQWHEPCRASLEIIRKLLDAHRILGLAADGVGVNRRRVRTALQHHDFGLRTRRVGGDAALAQSAETSDVMFVCLALCLSCRLPVRLSRCLALFADQTGSGAVPL